ncbi:MAG: diacylglycerol/lipid kinase family protein [Thermoguttaceae bacterium]
MPSAMFDLPPAADTVVLCVNPKAGRASSQPRIDRLTELLAGSRYQVEVFADLDQAAACAGAWHAQGRLRALIGVGGDGTAAALVNRTPPGLPLGMLPAGTENLLARHFRLGTSAESCARAVAAGRLLRVDAARAAGRIFLLMVGCGFDAAVVDRLHRQRTGHVRRRSYFKPIVAALRSYRYPELRVYLDEGTPRGGGIESPPLTARWLFAFNLPCYGGGLRIAPQADGSDGLLDVCMFRRGNVWHGLRYLGAVLLGRHQALADCTIRRARRLRITAEDEVPYQLDGDPGGRLPVEIETLPGRLTLLAPAPE